MSVEEVIFMYNDELYHFGIKGQKWGVRRYQNKDGSLTPAGKKRYGDETDNKKKEESKHRLTSDQKKAIAIGAGVAGAMLIVYGGYKLSNSRYFDKTIKAGEKFYRQGHRREAHEGLNELIYASFRKSDVNKYRNLKGDGDVEYVIKNASNVKIAGVKNAERIFNDVVKNNPEFRKHYGHMSYKDFNGSLGFANKAIIEQNKLYGKTLKDMYHSPFFEEIEKRGYNAIMDTQDSFAKLPVILLNTANTYKIHN